MNFIDNEHEEFFEEKMKELSKLGKTDVYYKSLVYTLSICETTREHFNEIFDIRKSELDLDSIQKGWQTSTSLKVTRMALNLWNHNLMYDSEEDLRNEKISSSYAPSEIFCCSYAPYFWEAVKIRYPEYTKEIGIAHRERYSKVITHIEDSNDKPTGIYIRTSKRNEEETLKKVAEYCKDCNIKSTIIYMDIGYSGLDIERKALQVLKKDIESSKIKEILYLKLESLFRNPIEFNEFAEKCEKNNVDICCLMSKNTKEAVLLNNIILDIYDKDY